MPDAPPPRPTETSTDGPTRGDRPLALLDRDGTLIENVPYLSDPSGVRLIPGVGAALRRLRSAGWRMVMVSNQSGIGRGLLSVDDVERVNARMASLLAAEGAWLDAMVYCPHAPEAGCACRKPLPALGRRAMEAWGAEASRTVVVGDSAADMGLAEALGVRGWLVRTGHGAETAERLAGHANIRVAADLPDAVNEIIDIFSRLHE